MKAYIAVTDEDGQVFAGEVELVASVKAQDQNTQSQRHSRLANSTPGRLSAIDLSLPIRAFAKKHAAGMGGPQKFTLVLAHMAGGDTKKQIVCADVEKQWNRMSGLLGSKFNSAYPTRARDQGWVDSTGKGTYRLLTDWRGIFKNA
jgi:hypothetical protein